MPRPPSTTLIPALADCEAVFTLPGLVAAKVPRTAVEALMRNKSRSTRLLPGVYVAHNGPTTDRELDLAALRYAGDDALLTAARALVLQGVREAPHNRNRHLLIPTPARRASTGFVIITDTERMPVPQLIHGIPVAPAARAALDLARATKDERLVQVMLSELLRDRRCTVPDLLEELGKGPRWGSAIPRRVLAGLHAGARSKPELDALALFTQSVNIPQPITNAHLYDENGRWIACVDFYWKGVVAEIQSKLYHFALQAWESDETRKARLASHGLLVTPIVPTRLYKDWVALEPELASAIEAAASNTCRVTVGPPPEWWGNRMG